MSSFLRALPVTVSVAGLVAVLGATPALARTHHHYYHIRHHVTHHAASSEGLRAVQQHLYNLGYYKGRVDGVTGPQTRTAIRLFQREHGLKADGVAGPQTRTALASADAHINEHVIGMHSFPAPIFNNDGTVVSDHREGESDDFATSMNGGTRSLATRFAHVDVAESGNGSSKRYDVRLNGQPILVADGQPTVVGMSSAYDLGNQDAVIFTTFGPDAAGCTYRNHILTLTAQGTQLLDIESCTRNYKARVENGSLFITFTDLDSGNAIGSTWRLLCS